MLARIAPPFLRGPLASGNFRCQNGEMAFLEFLADIRLISIDSGKLHLMLAGGAMDLMRSNRDEVSEDLRQLSDLERSEHVMFDDGILSL
jgi:hypothetical protein